MNAPIHDKATGQAQTKGYIDMGNDRRMWGGSFFKAPFPWEADLLTINLMAESPQLLSDIYFPIQDFSVPDSVEALKAVFEHINTQDEDVYVGCWGGVGRTGLFMSCYLKYMGHENPLEIVRRDYNSHAVETDGQKEFLQQFPTKQAPTPIASFKNWWRRHV